jgi:hypothetical protein
MEYFTSENGQIQADIAYRLGKIIVQYERMNFQFQENFDSTLHIATLQNVLTSCVELFNNLKELPKYNDLYSIKGKSINDNCFIELKESMIIKNTFNNIITIDWLLRCLRNSLSHPTFIDIDSITPSTGYTTIPDGSGIIKKYLFVASPDTKKNIAKRFDKLEKLNKYAKKEEYQFEYKLINGFYYITNPRYIILELTNDELKNIALNICTFLAQPVQKNWDRNDFNLKILYAA